LRDYFNFLPPGVKGKLGFRRICPKKEDFWEGGKEIPLKGQED